MIAKYFIVLYPYTMLPVITDSAKPVSKMDREMGLQLCLFISMHAAAFAVSTRGNRYVP
jgi:hypothetical protein